MVFYVLSDEQGTTLGSLCQQNYVNLSTYRR